MANNKFYTVEKEINGTKYVAQFNGMSAAMRAIDDCYIDGSSNISNIKLGKYLFDKVIVEPKGLTIDDFDCIDELSEVTNWARDVMQGKFRHEAANNSAVKEKSGK